jgi:putative membrane protein
MELIVKIIIALIAFAHLYFLWLEMFAWDTEGKKKFKGALPEDLFTPTKTLAANQGLYNGFLAAGLIWSLVISNEEWSRNISIFFLSCVLIAGIYGGYSATKKIFYVQAVPAIIAILLIIVNTLK